MRFESQLSQVLPEVLDRVQLGGAGRQEEQGDVAWHLQLAGGVPSGAIEREDGVGDEEKWWKERRIDPIGHAQIFWWTTRFDQPGTACKSLDQN